MKSALILFFITLSSTIGWSQTDSVESVVNRDHIYIGGFRYDIKKAIRESTTPYKEVTLENSKLEKSIFIPLPLDRQDVISAAIMGAAGLVIFQNDRELMNLVQDNRGSTQDAVALFGKYWGWGAPNIVGALGSYYIGSIYSDGKLRDFGMILMSSTLAAEAISFSLKLAVQRERPGVANDPYKTGGDYGNNYQSFPSGHAVAAMSLATLISLHYGDQYKALPVIAYAGAAATIYSRMYDQEHWASDLLVGSAIGYFVTKALYGYYKNGRKNGGLEVYPAFNTSEGRYSIYLRWQPKYEDKPCDTKGLTQYQAVEKCMSEALGSNN
jgi:membrane-associated phospholipid phosphatase